MLMKANEENIRLFQQKLCNMLDSLIDFFEENDITWFADSGTLLGAVRDGKMIDWDNDIDIVMPINDYVRFLKLAKEKGLPGSLKLNNVECNENSNRLHTNVIDYDTTFINLRDDYETDDKLVEFMVRDKMDTCMLIDIYGFEHVPERHCKFFKDYVAWTNFNQNYLCKRWKHPELYSVIDNEYSKALHEMYLKTLLKIDEAFKDSKYIIVHNCIPVTRYEDLQLKAEWYNDYVFRNFKYLKHFLRIPKGYQNILFLTYGDDYMTPIKDDHVGCKPFQFIFDVDSRQNFKTIDDFRKLIRKFN